MKTVIKATYSRTIQVHQYEPERIDIAAEVEIDENAVSIADSAADLLAEIRAVGEENVAKRLRVLEQLERNAGLPAPAPGPLAPDPFLAKSDDDVPF